MNFSFWTNRSRTVPRRRKIRRWWWWWWCDMNVVIGVMCASHWPDEKREFLFDHGRHIFSSFSSSWTVREKNLFVFWTREKEREKEKRTVTRERVKLVVCVACWCLRTMNKRERVCVCVKRKRENETLCFVPSTPQRVSYWPLVDELHCNNLLLVLDREKKVDRSISICRSTHFSFNRRWSSSSS